MEAVDAATTNDYPAHMNRVTAVGVLGFGGMGALALASPRSIAGIVDIGVESEMTENEIRAVYGGFGVAMGAALLVEGLRKRPGAAHRMCALALGGMSAGRIADLAIRNGEGDLGRPLVLAGAESVFAGALLSTTLSGGDRNVESQIENRVSGVVGEVTGSDG